MAISVPRYPRNPIHTDRSAGYIDVRFYFSADENPEGIRDRIGLAITASPHMASLISAYELVSDGFGRFTPDEKPLA